MKKESGQTLLIVVLVMVVALTVGLSVASRSITNLRTTTEEENSQRAFSAAEAGVERALKTLCSSPSCEITGGFTENRTQFTTVTENVSGTEFLINNGNPVFKDDGADVWLSNYPNYTSPLTPQFFTIYWGSLSESCPTASALEVIVISGSRNAPTTQRYAYDPCSRENNFTRLVPPSIGTFSVKGKTFQYRTPTQDINITNGLIVRAIPLYNSTPIAVSTCNPAEVGQNCTPLPAQGKVIESIGNSGGTARKVTLFQGYPKLPSEFFQYIIFSP